jgi:transposase
MLPTDHPVWDWLALVDELDLSAFETAYRADGRGRPPFHPRVMLALILYCRSKGFMSSRQVAAACYDDLGARAITGNRYPNKSTIDRFLDRHAAAINALLPQTLRIGHAEGLVDLSVVAGDGTKLVANAAMGATVTEAELLAQINDLQQQHRAAQAAWLEQVGVDDRWQQTDLFTDADADADADLCGTRRGTSTAAWRKVRTLTEMLRLRHTALAYLREHPNADVHDWAERLICEELRVG